MKAIVVSSPGGPEKCTFESRTSPEPDPTEVLVDVAATAVNRADLLQRMGHYPPPPGVSDVLGLECSGRVAAVGAEVTGWSVGDEVCALLAGGGHAERVTIPQGQLLPVPAGVSLVQAAALPEVASTVWSNLRAVAALAEGEWVLVHGGTGGIGTMATQVAAAWGARVITTVGSDDKTHVSRDLGAQVAVNYTDGDFVDAVQDATGGQGVGVILDIMGAKYVDRNLRCLAPGGRLVIIGLQGGVKAEVNLGRIVAKRLSVVGTTLRARSRDDKATIVAGVLRDIWPLISDGRVRPVIDRVLPWTAIRESHELMAESGHIGKIVLTVAPLEER